MTCRAFSRWSAGKVRRAGKVRGFERRERPCDVILVRFPGGVERREREVVFSHVSYLLVWRAAEAGGLSSHVHCVDDTFDLLDVRPFMASQPLRIEQHGPLEWPSRPHHCRRT
jgi:hypothetical protein